MIETTFVEEAVPVEDVAAREEMVKETGEVRVAEVLVVEKEEVAEVEGAELLVTEKEDTQKTEEPAAVGEVVKVEGKKPVIDE